MLIALIFLINAPWCYQLLNSLIRILNYPHSGGQFHNWKLYFRICPNAFISGITQNIILQELHSIEWFFSEYSIMRMDLLICLGENHSGFNIS